MNIYVIRHGQTDWNIQNKLQGKTDIPLNSTGIIQAKELSKNLKSINFDIIYSSPLKRAVDTANYINSNITPILDNRLTERDFGNFEGETTSIKEYWDYNKELTSNNVESISSFFKRISEFMTEIINKYKNTNKTILIACHHGTMKGIEIFFNGIPKDGNLLNINFKNCECRKYII